MRPSFGMEAPTRVIDSHGRGIASPKKEQLKGSPLFSVEFPELLNRY